MNRHLKLGLTVTWILFSTAVKVGFFLLLFVLRFVLAFFSSSQSMYYPYYGDRYYWNRWY